MSRLADYVRAWGREVTEGWGHFWFTPADSATLAIIRICAGAMLFYTHLVWSFDLADFFTDQGWLSPEAVQLVQRNSWTWSYFWWIKSTALLWTVHIAALVVFAMLTIGLLTRIVSVLAFVATLSYVGRVPGALFGLDQINVMLATYLMLGPSGGAYSVDRWLARRHRGAALPLAASSSVSANVAIRLIQVHMCIIYFFAGASKLSGLSWWNGTAMWLAMANLEYQSLDMTWMAHWPRLINLMTHVTILWELYYCALIWPRLSRPIMLIVAVPLHMGIAVCLGMMTFGVVMLIGNIAFVPPWFVRGLFADRRSQQGRAGEGGMVGLKKTGAHERGPKVAGSSARPMHK